LQKTKKHPPASTKPCDTVSSGTEGSKILLSLCHTKKKMKNFKNSCNEMGLAASYYGRATGWARAQVAAKPETLQQRTGKMSCKPVLDINSR
jgi:hypothetical protein